MSRRKLRPQGKVIERCRVMRDELEAALAHVPGQATEPAVVDAVWRGESARHAALGAPAGRAPGLRPPLRSGGRRRARARARARLREAEDIELERDSARLWLWRARTTELQATGELELPVRYATFDQLIAATAMRGYEQGVLPAPMRGDFRAYGKVYRHLTPEQQAEAHSIAARAAPRAELALWGGHELGRRSARHVISTSLLSCP